ncbi:hypothetical protein [Azotobacter salinestris]|uniref:hypothetical protein n=1 Tax=Azotobacter salinestris TaxID=69964 RepID=UPI0032DFAC27
MINELMRVKDTNCAPCISSYRGNPGDGKRARPANRFDFAAVRSGHLPAAGQIQGDPGFRQYCKRNLAAALFCRTLRPENLATQNLPETSANNLISRRPRHASSWKAQNLEIEGCESLSVPPSDLPVRTWSIETSRKQCCYRKQTPPLQHVNQDPAKIMHSLSSKLQTLRNSLIRINIKLISRHES